VVVVVLVVVKSLNMHLHSIHKLRVKREPPN
jgi:hypothetical protein